MCSKKISKKFTEEKNRKKLRKTVIKIEEENREKKNK